MNPTILALDASSTTIGWVLYDGGVLAHETIALKHQDLNHRCRLARAHIHALLLLYPDLDCVALEAPGGSFRGSVIAQCYVSGAIRSLVAELNIAICDVSAAQAKKALTRCGTATKRMMIERAAPQFGYYLGNLEIALQRGTFWALLDGQRVYDEHQADAFGCALAAVGMVSVVDEVAA